MTDSKIPSAEEIFQEEANFILREGTYEFQLEKILEEIKKLNKDNNTVTVTFKALPDERLLEDLENQGYRVKFDTYYDSSKTEKFMTRVRVTNPKFADQKTTFLDNLEDQMRGCAFSQGDFAIPEDAKKMFQSFMSNLK
tara:strand:- start:553 stop:969 length:417 start_codon:yes stop_codon:yes gene_type:complete